MRFVDIVACVRDIKNISDASLSISTNIYLARVSDNADKSPNPTNPHPDGRR